MFSRAELYWFRNQLISGRWGRDGLDERRQVGARETLGEQLLDPGLALVRCRGEEPVGVVRGQVRRQEDHRRQVQLAFREQVVYAGKRRAARAAWLRLNAMSSEKCSSRTHHSNMEG